MRAQGVHKQVSQDLILQNLPYLCKDASTINFCLFQKCSDTRLPSHAEHIRISTVEVNGFWNSHSRKLWNRPWSKHMHIFWMAREKKQNWASEWGSSRIIFPWNTFWVHLGLAKRYGNSNPSQAVISIKGQILNFILNSCLNDGWAIKKNLIYCNYVKNTCSKK